MSTCAAVGGHIPSKSRLSCVWTVQVFCAQRAGMINIPLPNAYLLPGLHKHQSSVPLPATPTAKTSATQLLCRKAPIHLCGGSALSHWVKGISGSEGKGSNRWSLIFLCIFWVQDWSWWGTVPQIFRKGTVLLKVARGVRLKLSRGCRLQAPSCCHGKRQWAAIALEKPSFSSLLSIGWVSVCCRWRFFTDSPGIM